MDFSQDFLCSLEDNKNIFGFSEALACDEDNKVSSAHPTEWFSTAVLTPGGVMGWLTGQKHKPFKGANLENAVKFNHD